MRKFNTCLIAFIMLFSACSPTFYLNGALTKAPEYIEIREVKALILRNGEIFTDHIYMKDDQFFSGIRPIAWSELAALEVKQTKFGDVIAAPLEVIGGASVLTGGGLIYLGGNTADDSEDADLGMMGAGVGIMASGVVLYQLGRKLRPLEQKATRTIYILKQPE